MAINEVFPKPTVKQVIFEMRFPNLFYIESKIPELQLKIMSEFPESSLAYRQQVVLANIGSEAKIEEIQKNLDDLQNTTRTKIWQFKSKNKYELGISFCNISIKSEYHKTYNNPNSEHRFRDMIQFVTEQFFSVVPVPVITRIGLRYIDECPIFEKTNASFLECYNTAFPLNRFPIDKAKEMAFRTVIEKGKHKMIYIEALQNNDNGELVLMLDFDGYQENIKPSDCLTVTDELHDIIIAEYESSLREPIFNYMKEVSDLDENHQ